MGGTCGSVHTQTFNNNLKELGVVESERSIIQKGLVHELLDAQDTVLCSYFAQRSGERDASQSGDRNVEEAFQGLDSFIEVWSEAARWTEERRTASRRRRRTG